VADLSSKAVEKAIFYCGGEFERCEIYAARMALEKGGLKNESPFQP